MSRTLSGNRSLVSLTGLYCGVLLLSSANAMAQEDPPFEYTLRSGAWEQISLPGSVGDSTIEILFGDDLSADTYGTKWVAYRYSAADGEYDELALSDSVSEGEGFWITHITEADVVIDVPSTLGAPALEDSEFCATEAGCARLALVAVNDVLTWNMIGSPFPLETRIADYRYLAEGGSNACDTGCSIEAAEAAGLAIGQLWRWDSVTEEYVDVVNNGSLMAVQGVWYAPKKPSNNFTVSLLVPNPVPELEPLQVGITRLSPSAAVVGSVTTVTVTSTITDVLLDPTSVKLLRTDQSSGGEELGVLVDNGLGADASLGDGIFSFSFDVEALSAEVRTYEVIAQRQSDMQLSRSGTLEFVIRPDSDPMTALDELADSLQRGDIESALTFFSGADKHRKLLESLAQEQLEQLAEAFDSASMTNADGTTRLFDVSFLDTEGVRITREIMLAQSQTGEWIIISW